MAPNDDAMLIGGGLILLAILAMGGGDSPEKTSEIIVIPRPDEGFRPMQGIEDDRPEPSRAEPDKGKGKQGGPPPFDRAHAILAEAKGLIEDYEKLKQRIHTLWLSITHDERKRGILHPGTVSNIVGLLGDMKMFETTILAKTRTFESSLYAIPNFGNQLHQAVDNLNVVYAKLNVLLAQSRDNRDDRFLQLEDMQDLQDELVERLGFQRNRDEFGFHLGQGGLHPQDDKGTPSDNLQDDFKTDGGGGKRSPDGTEHLTFDNSDGNKRHQNVTDSTAKPAQGTSNNIMDPNHDIKARTDPHTIAHPESLSQHTDVVGPTTTNVQHPQLESVDGGKKGKKTNALEIDLTGHDTSRSVSAERDEEDTRQKRTSHDVNLDDKEFTVSKKEKPDDLETETTGFEPKVKNEAVSTVVAFSSGGLHGGSQLNPTVNVDWASEWMKQLDAREYEPLKKWFQAQLQTTRSNQIRHESIETSGTDPEEVRQKQQVVEAKQEAIATKFTKDNAPTSTKDVIIALNPGFYTGNGLGAWPIWILYNYGYRWAKKKVRNTYENAHKYLSSVNFSFLEGKESTAKGFIPQGAALICMWRHVAFATDTGFILKKRTPAQAQRTSEAKRRKKGPEGPGGN